MVYSFLELYQARKWALDILRLEDNIHICINLDVDRVNESWRWFLECMPHEEYNDWLVFYREGKYMIFTRSINNAKSVQWYLRFFHDDHSLYVGLYDENGKRAYDGCLVIWDRKAPHMTNPGHAGGRCPEEL